MSLSPARPLDAAAVASIERATLEAVVPDRLEELPGWLLPMLDGTVGRARSAVPLNHQPPDAGALETIEQRYVANRFQPAFRLPALPAFEVMRSELATRGYAEQQPTLTQVGGIEGLLSLHDGPAGDLQSTPDAAWMAMFLGPGLDPADGVSRSRALARATGTLFASVREGGETVASGAAAFGHGWLSVHGMRTASANQGRGLARRVLRTMALEAKRRGIERVFLQVDASNAPALSLYRRAGLLTAWAYAYWRRPD